jgi:hypothetical protein
MRDAGAKVAVELPDQDAIRLLLRNPYAERSALVPVAPPADAAPAAAAPAGEAPAAEAAPQDQATQAPDEAPEEELETGKPAAAPPPPEPPPA